FEKLAMDVEILQMFASFFEPLRIDAETLAADVIADVGPGGHFFAHPHTLARYETAFYAPVLFDWRNFETWQEHGSRTATERASTLVEEALLAYEPPPLDPGNLEAMKAFIAKRVEEGGSPVN
ncbi:MAG: trimethylamine methyltransferase family protein, partial [Hyphomicrobiales bacterium]|nr:trimethylamine methyltransferase family protein [Hyphomicrobiales bacterium]